MSNDWNPPVRMGTTAAESKPVIYPPVGWTCPVCNRGLAPDVKVCDHKPQMVTNQPHHYGTIGTAPPYMIR